MFLPKRVLVEEKALQYEQGRRMADFFFAQKIPIDYEKNVRVKLAGNSQQEKYHWGKDLLVIGVQKTATFQSCKPSAHYQLPLVSGCMGMCEYCYLHTRMSKRPYVKVYANMEEILQRAGQYIEERLPEITIFEGAASSDPVPLEPYANSLQTAILYFAASPNGRFRFVTKFDDIDSLLLLPHNGHTEVRVSVNIDAVIRMYEHRTPSLKKRLLALERLHLSGYPIGVLIAPVFWDEANHAAYADLIQRLGKMLRGKDCTVEVISHRFTASAKQSILSVFPESSLPMEEEERLYRRGQFGYGKYLYPKDVFTDYKAFFRKQLSRYFTDDQILYII